MRLSRDEIRAKISEKKDNARIGLGSWEGFKAWVRVQDTALDQHGRVHEGGIQWSNEDLDPTPPEKRELMWSVGIAQNS